MNYIRQITCCFLFAAAGCVLAQSDDVEQLTLYLPINHQLADARLKTLQQHLNATSDLQWQVKFSDFWHEYQHGLRAGRPGIYFAPPHFAAWAINQHRFTPLLRLSGTLSYVIAVAKSDVSLFELNDLIQRPVCTTQPLNLDYLTLREAFKHNYQISENLIYNNVVKQMKRSRSDCSAFVVSDYDFRQIDLHSPGRYIRLFHSQQTRNYVFVAHPAVQHAAAELRQQLTINNNVKIALQDLYQRFSDDTRLVPTSNEDYPIAYTLALAPFWGAVSSGITDE